MIHRLPNILTFLFCFVLIHASIANTEIQHTNVAMRMIGHQVLLSAGDSTSRVLAIENKDNQYIINFESAFSFIPDDLIPTISKIMKDAQIENGYIVEVKNNETNSIIYNYEVGYSGIPNIIPCGLRTQDEADYSILVTILNQGGTSSKIASRDVSHRLTNGSNSNNFLLVAFLLLLLVISYFFYSKMKKSIPPSHDPNIISIGDSRYDKRNMKLSIKQNNIELTHKEAELLLLLHTSANAPLEREVILKKIWGDEGDYVGRTLDVYVSKLRKKIEPDARLKIVNIRGVGYKLVVNN